MGKITIAGVEFEIADRYAEGHVLNANEASALNQTFHENIGNNFRKKVKDAVGDEEVIPAADYDTLQSQIAEYATAYQFGVRIGGGGGATVRRDPVEAEAYRIARGKISEALRANGRKLKDVDSEKLEAAIEKVIAENPEITKQAKDIVKARQKAAEVSLEGLDLSAPTAEAA